MKVNYNKYIMGLFDFLFGNKKKERLERERQERLKREREERIAREREARLAENRRKEAERQTQKQASSTALPIHEKIVRLAGLVNYGVSSGNNDVALNAMAEMYTYVQRNGGVSLLKLPIDDLQCVGFAFTRMALFFDNGDEDINSVAAENAFYCLAKSYYEKNNEWTLPAIFTLLDTKRYLLKDKLISSWCTMTQEEVGMPIGLILGGNPFVAPHLADFRAQALGFGDDIMYFVLSKFFDIKKLEYTIPTDLFLIEPPIVNIKFFLNNNKSSKDFENGEKHFRSVYKECEDTLRKF